MPTRSALLILFLLLVGVPVGAAAYLGTAGLERERAMLVDRERDAMERRADEVRDALVRKLQQVYRLESNRMPGARGAVELPTRDHFEVNTDRTVAIDGADVPPDVAEFAQSDIAAGLLDAEAQAQGAQARAGKVMYATNFIYFDDLAARGIVMDNRTRLIQGFRIDPERMNRRYLDPAAPESVVVRFDERLERVRLVRDEDHLRVRGTGRHGLPQTLYRSPVPARRGDDPVLLPPGYVLAVAMHPASALERDLGASDERLYWTLGVVGVIVGLGVFFLWRAMRAESRLAARKEEFVNAVSHELRTPLTSIRMYADMLKEGWFKNEETAREYVGLISAESERLARLVNNVLDFSKIEKGRKSFEMQVGDPTPVVREVAELLRPYLKAKGFELMLDVPESLPACTFDKDALTQILVNLIDNAVKHGEQEVRLEADANNGRVQLRVLDRGPGVPESERELIFNPFARGERASPGGSGLGLALVHHYVTAHGGTISVKNRDGGGAAFALTLPAA